jgi:hypothetical protein
MHHKMECHARLQQQQGLAGAAQAPPSEQTMHLLVER